MSHRGYGFESEIENFFLQLTGQTKRDPILKSDKRGFIKVNRSFRVPSSGAMDSLKGDIITAIPWLQKQFKIECKSRYDHNKKEGQIIFIEKNWIIKNEQEAQADNQIPLLCFSFKKVKHNRVWWIIKEKDFMTYFESSVKARRIYPKQNGTIKFVHNKISRLDGVSYYSYIDNNVNYLLMPHFYFKSLLNKMKL